MQDVIERTITVKANKEKVYRALTDPSQIITWFPSSIEGTLEVGQQPIFVFGDEGHKARVHIEAATPSNYFAYRWIPGGNSALVEDVLAVPNTLVEFFIEEQEEGTKVTVKESGFASLPSDVAEASFNDNSGGWGFMMGRLETIMNQD